MSSVDRALRRLKKQKQRRHQAATMADFLETTSSFDGAVASSIPETRPDTVEDFRDFNPFDLHEELEIECRGRHFSHRDDFTCKSCDTKCYGKPDCLHDFCRRCLMSQECPDCRAQVTLPLGCFRCRICRELPLYGELDCGHYFCLGCLRLNRHHGQCPVCKKDAIVITSSDVERYNQVVLRSAAACSSSAARSPSPPDRCEKSYEDGDSRRSPPMFSMNGRDYALGSYAAPDDS
jgi:hypothetical protein